MDLGEVLLRTAIFGDLGRKDIEELVPALRQLTFARGESVWVEGDPATALYVVAEGQLKAYRISPEGAEVILEIVSNGDVTGEAGLFHPRGTRWVSVAAMVRTTCVLIPREPLLEFMSRHPPVMRRMLESLSEVAVRAAYSFTDVAFEDIRSRVARTLLNLADEQGEQTETGVRIRLKLSQATLASMIAASRENVNRALGHFVAQGAVSQQDGCFHVHDRGALEREAARS